MVYLFTNHHFSLKADFQIHFLTFNSPLILSLSCWMSVDGVRFKTSQIHRLSLMLCHIGRYTFIFQNLACCLLDLFGFLEGLKPLAFINLASSIKSEVVRIDSLGCLGGMIDNVLLNFVQERVCLHFYFINILLWLNMQANTDPWLTLTYLWNLA